jgi:iron complex transport system substrate-binding protein
VRAIALVLLVVGCDRPPAAGREVVDARGKTVRVPDPPRRIVSLLPGATELLFAVGAGEQVAGVTAYCDYPEAARSKPKIGDLVVSGEAVAALRPDLVLTTERLTRQSTADLERAGYAVFSIDPMSFEGIAEALLLVGSLTGHAAEGMRAAEEFLGRLQELEAPPGRGPTVYFEHSADPLGTTGPESYAGEAIRRAGGRNVFDGGWRLTDWESVLAKDPEVILVAHEKRDGLERRAGWKELRAVKSGRVHFVSKDHYVYPTPRLLRGLEECRGLFRAKAP